MLNCDFLEKVLGLDSPSHFVYDFSRKIFLLLYFINWTNLIFWLPLLLEILSNIWIVIIYYPAYIINFEINHSFLINPFSYITKRAGQKCRYLKYEKSFKITIYHKIKTIFHYYKGPSFWMYKEVSLYFIMFWKRFYKCPDACFIQSNFCIMTSLWTTKTFASCPF